MEILDPLIIRAILAGVAIAIVGGVVGCFVIWKRMAYFGESLAHSSLLGVGLGIVLGLGTNLGIILICLSFGFILLCLNKIKVFSTDSLLGVLAHFTLSLGIIVISYNVIRIDLHAFLFGDILTVTLNDLWYMYLGGLVIILLIFFNWSSILLTIVSEDLAKVEGINTFFINFILVGLITLVVSISIQTIGLLLISSMLIIPPASARRLVSTPEGMAIISPLIGVFSVIGGIMLSIFIDLPSGPTIVVFSSIIFFLIVIITSIKELTIKS